MAEETAPVAKRHRHKKLWIIAGVVALVIVAAGAGVALRWWQNRDGQNGGTFTPTPTLTQPAGDLQELRAEGNTDEFNKQADDILNDPSTDDETRYQVLLQKGHANFDSEDYDGAIQIYQQAEQLANTLEIADLLAETYFLAGDKANALKYYKKALQLVPDNNVRAGALRELYQNMIDELEGQQ